MAVPTAAATSAAEMALFRKNVDRSLLAPLGASCWGDDECASGHCLDSMCKDHFAALLATIGAECSCAALTLSDATSVTTTRASNAFCTASTGAMTSCGNNLPRVSSSGVLIEDTRTNLILRSQEIDNASHTKISITVTANTHAAPDGTTTADTLTSTGANARTNDGLSSATASAAIYSLATYFRSVSGTTASTGHDALHLAGAGSCVVDFTSTTTWVRRACAGATATAGATMIPRFNPGKVDAAAVQVAWGEQYEVGSAPSSYIPTVATAVARAADNISFAPSMPMGTSGCVSGTVTFGSVASADARLIGGAGATGIYVVDSDTVRIGDGTNTVSVDPGALASQTMTFRATWAGSVLSLTVNGVTQTGTFDGDMDMGTVYLGSQQGSSNFLFGHEKNLKFGTSATGCAL